MGITPLFILLGFYARILMRSRDYGVPTPLRVITSFKTLAGVTLIVSVLLTSLLIPSATYYVNAKETPQEQKIPDELSRACSCESSYEGTPTGKPQQNRTHLNKDGSTDFGVCMLNSVHLPTAKKMGLDIIKKEQDNFKMALEVYKKQGIKAWYAYNPKTKNCVWAKRY